MASKRASPPAKRLFDALKPQRHRQCLFQTRTMATHTSDRPLPSPEATLAQTYTDAQLSSAPTEPILQDHTSPAIPPRQTLPKSTQPHLRPSPHTNPFLTTATTTLHSFPTLEPTSFTTYPSTHLLLPLRKDLLHRAVVFEGDRTRQGTANTRHRTEVHGSNRKIRPQKGTGSARLGDKKSPMLKGGGVAFGPKPRDFATGLPRRIYDLAWRTALSYRYRMGQLLVLADEAELDDVAEGSRPRYLRELLRHNRMGNPDGRTLFITHLHRPSLFGALEAEGEAMGREARALEVEDVDVKDLLEMGRLVVEERALSWIFEEHQSDLPMKLRLEPLRKALRMRDGGAKLHVRV